MEVSVKAEVEELHVGIGVRFPKAIGSKCITMIRGLTGQ
jgi:hypothetical protein